MTDDNGARPGASKSLSAEDIDKAPDLQIDALHIPEWGGSVHIRSLPADEYVDLQDALQALKEKADGTNTKIRDAFESTYVMLAAALVDAQGQRLYADAAAARAALAKKNPTILLRIQQAIGDRVKAGATAAKNALGEVAPAASPTDSPSASGT